MEFCKLPAPWAATTNLPISVSQLARMTGMSHQHLADVLLLIPTYLFVCALILSLIEITLAAFLEYQPIIPTFAVLNLFFTQKSILLFLRQCFKNKKLPIFLPSHAFPTLLSSVCFPLFLAAFLLLLFN
jgi:hypothetical protein